MIETEFNVLTFTATVGESDEVNDKHMNDRERDIKTR